MKLGWARVSTKGQRLDLQFIALKEAGCKKILHDKISGKSKTSPELEAAIASLKRGDILIVWHLDRLGRNARELINLEFDLRIRGISLASLSQHYDTSTPRGAQTFLEDCVKAQGEVVRISERTIAGMNAARLKGQKFGRPKRFENAEVKLVRSLSKKMSTYKIAKRYYCAPATVWRALQPDYLKDSNRHHAP